MLPRALGARLTMTLTVKVLVPLLGGEISLPPHGPTLLSLLWVATLFGPAAHATVLLGPAAHTTLLSVVLPTMMLPAPMLTSVRHYA